MSHYLAGILKIIVIEAFMALLVVDRLTAEKWEREKHLAASVLTALMVFGFTAWGGRPAFEPFWLVAGGVMLWTCGWMVRTARGREDGPRAKRFLEFVTSLATRTKLPPVAVGGVLAGLLAITFCWFWVGRAPPYAVVHVRCAADCTPSIAGAFATRVNAQSWDFPEVAPGTTQLEIDGKRATIELARATEIEVRSGPDGITMAAPVPAGRTWVHQHEQFHFYLGAKYQKEVGWFDLYIAAIMADRETINAMAGVQKTRDNRTFEEMDVAKALEQAPRIRAKFTAERWEAFKADWVTMAKSWPWMNWQGVMNDHGNSNSPAWSLVASPIAALVPLTPHNQSLLGCLDILLMLALFIVVYETFAWRQASVALFMFACVPVVFDYLGGSFLRWDWLFALGLAVCALEKQRWGAAGALFGYAVATKLFPIFFGVALLLKVAWQWKDERKLHREWIAFGRNAAIVGVACVVLSSIMFGTSAWTEYVERIQVAQLEKFYSNQHSLKTVFLQVFAPGEGGLGSGIFPPVIKQSLPEVNIAEYSAAFLIVRLLFTGVILVLLRRATDLQAFTLGPLLVLTWLTVNMYYWNMLALLALGLATRAGKHFFLMLLAFFATYITYYTYQHLNRGFAEGYLVALIFVTTTIVVAAFEFRSWRRGATNDG